MLKLLQELRQSDLSCYGGKAARLGELINKGEQVPDGFALSTEFFMEFLSFNKFSFTTKDYLERNREIINFILNGQFSLEMERALMGLFNEIQGVLKYVVRSSALCEDNELFSMAGMFSSFINLDSFEDVKLSIKRCYASMFEDRVIAYFLKNNINFSELKMGVIVQGFIAGDYSGVNFSVDTIDMDKEIMHINIAEGLCENYVGGMASSAFYKLNKAFGEIIEERIPDNFNIPHGDMIKELYKRTLEIEKYFNKHLDIEWTIKDNQVFILQVRPITTFRVKNFEVSWMDRESQSFTWYLGSNKPYEPLINELSLLHGEALNRGYYATGFLPYYSDYCVLNGYFYYRDREMINQRLQEEKFKALLTELNDNNRNIFQDIILPRLLVQREELDSYVGRNLTRSEQVEFLEKSIAYLEFLAENHWAVTHGCDYLENFMNYLKKMGKGLEQEDYYDLVFGISILNKEREYFIKMVNVIKTNKVLDEMFRECSYDEILYARINKHQEGRDLIKLLESYIQEFGICTLDSDTESPYPEPLILETPCRIFKQLRGLLNIDNSCFRSSIENTLRNKESIKANILSELDEKEREDFLRELNLAEKAFLSRDNHHFYFERMTKSYLRLALREAEHTLFKNKQLYSCGDIYFLTFDEIKVGLLEGSDFKETIIKRKELFNSQKKLLAPSMIGKVSGESIEPKDGGINEEVNYLDGLSGLRKKVRGKVRIGMPEFLNEACILVLPFTRCCELTLVAKHVLGIIVELGSPFEHLGIIARELDIPVLYNVENATSILVDGEEVILDGVLGRVNRLKEGVF